MSTISVNNIQTTDANTDLAISTGTANAIVVGANGELIIGSNNLVSNSSSISFMSNTFFVNTSVISTNLAIISNTANITANNITANNITVGNTTANTFINSTSISLSNTSSSLILTPSSSLGFRNRIINGQFWIDQHQGGILITPTNGAFMCDRWRYGGTQASKFNTQVVISGATGIAGFNNCLTATVASAYSVTSTDYFYMTQAIETPYFADFGFGTSNAKSIALSFWVQSSITGTHSGTLRNYAGTRSYPFTFTISSANTWTYITTIIPADTTGTWVSWGATGCTLLTFNLGTGSSYLGTAGSWVSGNYTGATGSVNIVGTASATFSIAGVQLEPITVTPFENRIYGLEYMLCQRYYQVLQGALVTWTSGNGTYGGALDSRTLQVQLRASPTATVSTVSSGGGWVGTGWNYTGDTGYYQVWPSNASIVQGSYAAYSIRLTAEL